MSYSVNPNSNPNPNVHKVSLKDTHYLSLWDKNDLPKVDKIQAKIRATHDQHLINDFFDIMNKKWNDHHNNLPVEPLQLSRDDKFVVTYKGIGRMCQLITLQESISFRYVAVGVGAPADTNPMPFDQDLHSEEGFVDVRTNGFFDGTGTSLRYGGTFGEGMITDNYNESLIRTTPNDNDSGRVSLCVASFFDNPIDHTQGNTGFTAAGSIEFNIIMDISQ